MRGGFVGDFDDDVVRPEQGDESVKFRTSRAQVAGTSSRIRQGSADGPFAATGEDEPVTFGSFRELRQLIVRGTFSPGS